MTDQVRLTPAGVARAATSVLAVFAVCVVGLLAAVPARAQVVAAAETKYYIVGKPANGQKEFLFAIAVKTLGDGRRQDEILELNRDRPQPDGRRMTDLLTVEPGWILLLPPDAHGDGVVTGPLPEVPANPAATPGPTRATATQPAEPGQENIPATGVLALVTSPTAAFAFTAVLFVSFLFGRRRRRRATSRTATTAAPQAIAGDTAVQPAAVRASRGEPAPPRPLRVDLRCGDDVATVRLIGVRTVEDSSPAHRWLAANQSPPAAAAPVVLGHNTSGRLWVDLALAPDVLTITGHPDACRRQIIVLISQLRQAGTPVTVVGDALRPWLPADCHQITALSELDSPARRPNETEVVVCAGAADHTLAGVHTLLNHSERRFVPIVVGGVAPARWSVRMALGEPDSDVR